MSVGDFPVDQGAGDHADGRPTMAQDGISKNTHKPNISSAVDQGDLSLRQSYTHGLGDRLVLCKCARPGPAEHTNSLHLMWRLLGSAP